MEVCVRRVLSTPPCAEEKRIEDVLATIVERELIKAAFTESVLKVEREERPTLS